MVTEGVLKIKLNKVPKMEGPTQMTIAPRFMAVVDVDGSVTVPRRVAMRLLGPGYPGIWSLVEEVPKKVEAPIDPEAKKVMEAKAPEKRSKGSGLVPPQTKEESSEFAKEIV